VGAEPKSDSAVSSNWGISRFDNLRFKALHQCAGALAKIGAQMCFSAPASIRIHLQSPPPVLTA
jgi:hypothetical protein